MCIVHIIYFTSSLINCISRYLKKANIEIIILRVVETEKNRNINIIMCVQIEN